MAHNVFLLSPPVVHVWDPAANAIKQTIAFLGDVPKAIYDAAEKYNAKLNKPAAESAKKILREYYGANFKSKLGFAAPRPASKAGANQRVGGTMSAQNDTLVPVAAASRVGAGYMRGARESASMRADDADYLRTLAMNRAPIAIAVDQIAPAYAPPDQFEEFMSSIDPEPIYLTRLRAGQNAADAITSGNAQYAVVSGQYKLAAARAANAQTVPAVVLDSADVNAHVGDVLTRTGGAMAPAQAPEQAPADAAQSMEVLLSQYSFGEDSDIADLLREDAPAGRATAVVALPRYEGGVKCLSVRVYPEDNIYELKNKIHIATQIPAYRQFLFWLDGSHSVSSAVAGTQTALSDASINVPYRLYADGAYSVDLAQMMAAGSSLSRASATADHETIYGVPIDRYLYDIRESIRVEALDTFMILGNIVGAGAATAPASAFYVVDLAQFIAPRLTQLRASLDDTYQFELLYYGFVIKYFPMLTRECFYDYVRAEVDMPLKYPDLARGLSALQAAARYEQEICDVNYRSVSATRGRADADASATTHIAITQLTAQVNARGVLVDVRNLYDLLRVGRKIPEIHAYVEHDKRKYMLRKHHRRAGMDIQFPAGTLMKTGITLAVSVRKEDQDTFHSRRATSTLENEMSRYMFLCVYPTGRYYVRALWNDEDGTDFAAAVSIIAEHINPIIRVINGFGRHVFMLGTALPEVSAQSVIYQSLGVCVFWKKTMLQPAFKLMRALWDKYIRAGIVLARGSAAADRYEFMFRKGMYEFDASAIEKIITAANNTLLTNQYAHLSSNVVKQKWDQNYDGRVMRMIHRTADIKFEILDIREQEFRIFELYIGAFVRAAAQNETMRAAWAATRDYHAVKKLRKLREQDPELFNLKKHGSKKTYSVLCQNKNQPIVYTDDELRALGAGAVNKLVKYWNFTLDKPAYYGCPTREFGNLSFLVGYHPRGYCLPCCSKKPQGDEEKRRGRVYNRCLTDHVYLDAGEGSLSRHIMAYGKDVDFGRLAKLPAVVQDLLIGASTNAAVTAQSTTADTKLQYYLVGVEQNMPAVEHAGLYYALASALETTVAKFAAALVHDIGDRGLDVHFLLDGAAIDYFASTRELTGAITEIFVQSAPAGKRFALWTDLAIELMYVLYNTVVVVLVDDRGDGAHVRLYIAPVAYNAIKRALGGTAGAASSAGVDQKYIFVMKKQNRYYPMYLLSPEEYFRKLVVAQRVFVTGDPVVQLVHNMITYERAFEAEQYNRPLDLTIAEAFVNSLGAKILRRYINKQNTCYGVLIEYNARAGERAGESAHAPVRAYMPINYSAYTAGGSAGAGAGDSDSDTAVINEHVAFARAECTVDIAGAIALIEQFNAWVESNHAVADGVYRVARVTIEHILRQERATRAAANDVHEIIGCATSAGIWYVGGVSAVATADATAITQYAIVDVPYDYTEVNALIIDSAFGADGSAGAPATVQDSGLAREYNRALYQNYYYQLFLLEFMSHLRAERNTRLRGELHKLFTGINFKKITAQDRTALEQLLARYPNDLAAIQREITALVRAESSAGGSAGSNKLTNARIIDALEDASYEFDRTTLHKLRALAEAAYGSGVIAAEAVTKYKNAVIAIAREIATEGEIGADFTYPNIYVSCVDAKSAPALAHAPVDAVKKQRSAAASAHATWCIGKKLIVPSIEEVASLLAADIANDLKATAMAAGVLVDTVTDYFAFIQRAGEVNTIYRLDEL